MSWINLLDVIYPVGSLYFSTSSTSPSATIGGTWTQIKGATIAAVGANGVSAIDYSGSLKISIEQMPRHQHNLIYANRDNYNTTSSANVNAFDISVNHWQDDKLSVTTQAESSVTFSSGAHTFTGGGQDYMPYNFGVYIWYRAA